MRYPIRRHRLLALCVGAIGVVLLAGAAQARAQWHWWGALRAECRYSEPGGYPLNAAVVRATMVVANDETPTTHWAEQMKIKARLVPDESGDNFFENWSRSWSTSRTGYLLPGYTYHRRMAVTTGTVNPAADWKVQYKLIWERGAPLPDVGSSGTLPFHSCGPRSEEAITYGRLPALTDAERAVRH
ncbi:MAG: hypothetical protein U0R71_05775 [Solirubrobacterales bacterium]